MLLESINYIGQIMYMNSTVKIISQVKKKIKDLRWLSGKESTCNAGDAGLIPGSGRSPGEVNGNPFQYSHPGNLMDRGGWQATVHGVAKSWT